MSDDQLETRIAADDLAINSRSNFVEPQRFRRITHLSPNAVAWLRLVESADDTKPVCPGLTRVRAKRVALAKKTGIEWDQDLMRHTSASMMLARDRDAGKVAEQLGHSPAILLRHYRELVSDEAAARYWKVFPEMKETALGSTFRSQP